MKTIVAALAAVILAGTAVPAWCQDKVTFTIISHKVHENVARGLVAGTTGGDIVAEWAERNNVEINWITAGIDPVHDRLFRELALRETEIDLAFIIDKYMTPRMTGMLEPLDAYMESAPVEHFEDIPPNLLAATRHGDSLVAIPYRHSTGGTHWNVDLFAEAGLDHAPTTREELIEYARKLTTTRPDGTRVNGYIGNFGEGYGAAYGLLGLYGVKLFGDDLSVHADTPEMVEGLTMLAQLYKEGVLPSNYATIGIDEVGAAIMDGRAAMTAGPFARYTVYNNPETSRYAGKIRVAPNPLALMDDPHQNTEIWSMAIPANSTKKDLAWSLIQELSTRENTLRAALNGNSPVRVNTYEDERFKAVYPYTVEEAQALSIATVLPSFETSPQAWSVFAEEIQAAVIGLKSPEDAARSMQERIEPLVANLQR